MENEEKTLFHLINNTTCGLELLIIIHEKSLIFKSLLIFYLSYIQKSAVLLSQYLLRCLTLCMYEL